jgi:glutaryl-CoA dehydrogenase
VDFFGFKASLSPRERDELVRIREFLDRRVAPIADAHWERAEFPRWLIPELGALGVLGYGFEETRLFESSTAFRGWATLELARADASIAGFVGVQAGLVMGAIAGAGSAEQRSTLLPQLASGMAVGSFALTEPQSGSDIARGLATTARREGDEWVLDGVKRWIGNATFADIVLVFAKDTDDGQVKGFVVPGDARGLTAETIERKWSMRSLQNADVRLSEVRIPESSRLPGIGSFKDVARILGRERIEVAWLAIGVAVGAYDAALRYAREREQFGAPIATKQLVQDLLVTSLGNITASIALCMRVSELQDRGRQEDRLSSLAKLFATARARESVAWCREVLGGNGILLDSGVTRHFLDAEAIYSFEGTREMNALIVGRAITGMSAFG